MKTVLILVLVLFVRLDALADTLDRIAKSGVITLGHREASIPFSYVGPDRRPIGYTVDICAKVVEAIRSDLRLPTLEVKTVQVNGATRIPAVKEGKIDLECGSTTNTPERRQQVAFSMPFYIAGAKLMAKRGTPINGLEDLSGQKVVTNENSTSEKRLRSYNEQTNAGVKLTVVKDFSESFQLLTSGQAAIWMVDDVILYAHRAKARTPAEFVISDKGFTVEPLAIMMVRDDSRLLRAVDAELRRLMTSGEILRIYSRWFQQPIPPEGLNLDLPINRLTRSMIANPGSEMPVGF